MRVSRGRLNLCVAEKLADHRQPLAIGDGRRGECVPQVVDPGVLEARPGADTLPEGLEVRQPRARLGSKESPLGGVDGSVGAGKSFLELAIIVIGYRFPFDFNIIMFRKGLHL